jgi:hypothetical protein
MGMNADEVRQSAGRLYAAVKHCDVGRVAALVTETAFIAVPGHEGSGGSHLASLVGQLHARGFRTWNEQSADVLASEHHAVVLDRWLSDDRGLDEHITMLAADPEPDGQFGLVSIYGYDAAKIRAFFA